MRLNDLSQLGSAYDAIMGNPANKPVNVSAVNKTSDILLTDATQYLPEAKEGAVKVGSGLGGGPSGLAKGTGPGASDNFKKVSKQEDPGSDSKTMDKEEDGEEDNAKTEENAKNTTSEKKLKESGAQNNKYKYQPRFNTMSKPKFDKLFEDAINGMPFNDSPASSEPTGVEPADDVAADAPELGDEVEAEEETLTHEEAIACVEKLLKFLKKDEASDEEQGSLDAEDGLGDDLDVGASEDEVVAEDVETEDEGTPLTKVNGSLKKGNPDGVKKIQTVGNLKATGKGTAQKGSLKFKPEPEELGDKSGSLTGKSNKVGGVISGTGKSMLET
jgi:hypothetical protein